MFRAGGWERREDYRWRLRKMLGLDSPLLPGKIPAGGHGRPVGFLPPDGEDYQVECLMGGAAAWRRDVFARHQFSHYFEGYGLYEDMDFCIRASSDGPLYVNTRARLAHHHAATSRPNNFRYGEMVVRNGWFVWRRRWPQPGMSDRARWWAVTLLLALCRLADLRGTSKLHGPSEAFGRLYGAARVLWKSPLKDQSDQPRNQAFALQPSAKSGNHGTS
jgi:GT2 family glycosyltransferase